MNYKKILITIVVILSLISLAGCGKKVEIEVIEGIEVPNWGNNEQILDDVSGEITEITPSGETKEFVSGDIEIENKPISGDVSLIRPTKILDISSEDIEILKTIDFDYFYFLYETASSKEDVITAYPELSSAMIDLIINWDSLTGGYIYQSSGGCCPCYLETLYKATSTLEIDGYNYSIDNLNNIDIGTAWVEGVNGYGIGEKITLYMQENSWFTPELYGYIGNMEDGYRTLTEDEVFSGKYNDIGILASYEKDGIEFTYEDYLSYAKVGALTDEGYYSSLDGLYIVNGYAKSEKLFKENSRVKKLKLTIDDDKEYIIELEDTMKPQLIDVEYKQEASFEVINPLKLTFEILEVYPGEKYEDTAITSLLINGHSNVTSAH